jgi:hypothetical protein
MPEEHSKTLAQLFEELRHEEEAAGAQAHQAAERRKHYLSGASTVAGILLFTLGMILLFQWSR